MKVGDLVKYKHKGTPHIGVVLKIMAKFERDDNILVMWNNEKAWYVAEHWIKHVV